MVGGGGGGESLLNGLVTWKREGKVPGKLS